MQIIGVEVEHFCIDHEQWFIEALNVTCGIPSHDTFNRVFNLIIPSELVFWITLWIENALPALTEKDILHLDGKVLEAYGSSHPLTLVRAWSERFHYTVGMVKVQNESNEITALPHLIETLYIKGKIITIDAIGAQKKIVSLIAKKGGDYVITLKANQHQFYHDIKLFMNDTFNGFFGESCTYTEQLEKGHGRIEKRRCIATDNIY